MTSGFVAATAVSTGFMSLCCFWTASWTVISPSHGLELVR